MLHNPVVYIVSFALFYVFLWLLKRYLGQPGLRQLPGPPAASFISGE